MTQIVVEIDDSETTEAVLRLLSAMRAVSVVHHQPDVDNAGAQQEQILSFAGSWLDMPDDMWQGLQSVLQHRQPFFAERDIAW